MFKNIGKKLQLLALIIFWLGTAASVLVFGWMCIDWGEFVFILGIPAGIFVSWLTTCGLYAFGRLVENSDKMVELMSHQNNTTNVAPASVSPASTQPVNYAPVHTATPVAPVQTAPAGKVCPNCNNIGEGSFCLYCGTALK